MIDKEKPKLIKDMNHQELANALDMPVRIGDGDLIKPEHPKDDEPKFKVGDKVWCKANNTYSHCDFNAIGEVKEIDDSVSLSVLTTDCVLHWDVKYIEHYTGQDKPAVKHEFKEGDYCKKKWNG